MGYKLSNGVEPSPEDNEEQYETDIPKVQRKNPQKVYSGKSLGHPSKSKKTKTSKNSRGFSDRG